MYKHDNLFFFFLLKITNEENRKLYCYDVLSFVHQKIRERYLHTNLGCGNVILKKEKYERRKSCVRTFLGGENEIRTHGTFQCSHDFQSCALDQLSHLSEFFMALLPTGCILSCFCLFVKLFFDFSDFLC